MGFNFDRDYIYIQRLTTLTRVLPHPPANPQMDGVARDTSALMFVLAATNLPHTLDFALLRRLEKRVYIALPDEASRLQMLRMHLEQFADPALDLHKYSVATSGYSGADIRLLCKEAAMRPLRMLIDKLEVMRSIAIQCRIHPDPLSSPHSTQLLTHSY